MMKAFQENGMNGNGAADEIVTVDTSEFLHDGHRPVVRRRHFSLLWT
ncbi:MAG: hypothetical protein ACLSBB_17800 [Ruthenibacterium lactatiformans]